MRLVVGQSKTITVHAGDKWNDTGFDVAAGEYYQFRAAGQWKDWIIRTDPEGYDSSDGYLRPLERFRRAPEQRWFALIGVVGRRKDSQFLIGADRRAKMAAAGRLYCFANDLPIMYWNNTGAVELTVRRLT